MANVLSGKVGISFVQVLQLGLKSDHLIFSFLYRRELNLQRVDINILNLKNKMYVMLIWNCLAYC